MSTRQFTWKSTLPVSAAEAFAWYKNPEVLTRLLPPWENVHIISHDGSVTDGSEVELDAKLLGPLRSRWLLRHSDYIPGKQFKDSQIKGPFSFYEHVHAFSEDGATSRLEDMLTYRLPLAPLSHIFAGSLINKRLERAFRFRHRVSKLDLEWHSRYRDRPRMSFLISGATGMLGTALCAFLKAGGHSVTRIVRSRRQAKTGDVVFGEDKQLTISDKSNFDCVINLAGAGIADKRWSPERKAELQSSRIDFTAKLIKALGRLESRPKTFLSASAVGFYGDTGESLSSEDSPKGTGFLADLCAQWEQSADQAKELGARVALLRLAPVLSCSGGVLKKMLPAFQAGFGATLATGEQQFAWIALDDVLRAILFLSYESEIAGPVNLVAPARDTNGTFTKCLAKTIARPAFFRVPAFLLRAAFGELADQALMSSAAAAPDKLLKAKFSFAYATLESALPAALGYQ